MPSRHFLAGPLAACAVIFCILQLLFLLDPPRTWDALSGTKSPIRSSSSSIGPGSVREEGVLAPLLVGAGQGTTGTHLFAEATCRLGFATLHHAIGCLPRHAISATSPLQNMTKGNRSDAMNVTAHPNQTKPWILGSIDHFREPWLALLRNHSDIRRRFLGLVEDDADALEVREQILARLEGIITWGKEHGVALALHDAPYPLLMPEILRLVRKHYGSAEAVARPFVLLTERDPQEYVRRRIARHPHSPLCRPREDQLGANSSGRIAADAMNATTLRGGAFDAIGCIDRALAGRESMPTALGTDRLFYSIKEAGLLHHRQYVADTLEDYQNAVRGSSILSYNVFGEGSRTSADDAAADIRRGMIEALTRGDGRLLRMGEGLGFLGFDNFFAGVDVSAARSRRRRRRHGDRYGDRPAADDARRATLDDLVALHFRANRSAMVPVHIAKGLLLTSLEI